jgi:hypothetical protein
VPTYFERISIETTSCAFAVLDRVGVAVRSPTGESEIVQILHALDALHRIGVIHGDPRLPNLVWVDGRLLWIDLSHAAYNSTPELRRRDWYWLTKSITEFHLKNVPESTLHSLIDRVFRSDDGSSDDTGGGVSSNATNLSLLAAEILALPYAPT